MPRKTVSVLLAVYNAEHTLGKTLKSLANQSFTEFEILAVDDASVDNSHEVLGSWQRRFGPKKMRILKNKKNLGLTKSLNYGLQNISSPYTARIDADDWWESEKLAKQVKFLETHPDYGIVGSGYTNVSHRQSFVINPPETNEEIRASIIRRNPFAHSCVMFRTILVKNLGGYDISVRYGQDYDLWLRCLPKTKFYNLPENLCFRLITGGISIEKQRDQMKQATQTQLKYIRAYQLGWSSYLGVIEPWLISHTPRWLLDLKRQLTR